MLARSPSTRAERERFMDFKEVCEFDVMTSLFVEDAFSLDRGRAQTMFAVP